MTPERINSLMRSSLRSLLLAAALCAGTGGAAAQTFPVFHFRGLDGPVRASSDLKGKVAVVNFWFTACAPCVAEIPELNRLAESFRGQDVVFLAPAFDQKEPLKAFLAKHPFSYQVVLFEQDKPENYFPKGQLAFPMHVVIDRDGRLVYRAVGDMKPRDLQRAISTALGKGNT
jgi:peroxiredoxin